MCEIALLAMMLTSADLDVRGRIEKMEERNLPSRSSVVIKEMNTFDLDVSSQLAAGTSLTPWPQDARLPNARYAKQTGLVQVC